MFFGDGFRVGFVFSGFYASLFFVSCVVKFRSLFLFSLLARGRRVSTRHDAAVGVHSAGDVLSRSRDCPCPELLVSVSRSLATVVGVCVFCLFLARNIAVREAELDAAVGLVNTCSAPGLLVCVGYVCIVCTS